MLSALCLNSDFHRTYFPGKPYTNPFARLRPRARGLFCLVSSPSLLISSQRFHTPRKLDLIGSRALRSLEGSAIMLCYFRRERKAGSPSRSRGSNLEVIETSGASGNG